MKKIRNYRKTINLLIVIILVPILIHCNDPSVKEPETSSDLNSQYLEQSVQYLEQETQWVFMFYLGGDNDLEQFLIQDVYEIKDSEYDANRIKAIILLDRPSFPVGDSLLGKTSRTKAYTIIPSENGKQIVEVAIPSLNLYPGIETELNTADSGIFQEFVKFGKSLPADNYALFLGSHGSSWWNEFYNQDIVASIKYQAKINSETGRIRKAIIYDYTRDPQDSATQRYALDVDTVGSVLNNNPVDLIGFDACSMGTLEVAYALRNGAKYMAAAVDLEPADGWNYQKLFSRFQDGGTVLELGSAIVDGYGETYSGWSDYSTTTITMALYDLEAINGTLFSRLFGINGASALNVSLPLDRSLYYKSSVPKYDVIDDKIQFDISYLFNDALALDTNTRDELNQFLNELVIDKYISNSDDMDIRGIGISVPTSEDYKTNYSSLSFARETNWGLYIESLID